MELEQFISELKKNDENEFSKLISELINDKNIELKTEISNPLVMSILDSLGEYLEQKGLKQSSSLLKTFLFWFRVNMISFNRKSRTEYIKAISSLYTAEATEKEKEEKLLNKLLGK